MSFLTLLSPVFAKNSPALTASAVRSISSTTHLKRGAMEATKDAAQKVNRATSNAALRGIEKGGIQHHPLQTPLLMD